MADGRPEVERGDSSRSARVPPHNLQAEESLLGAMLLSKDAIASAVETVGLEDFYKPAHGHIFDAITSLYGAGEPSDSVTVAEELRRAGLLDAIGGQSALVLLQNNTPAAASAARYAKIVEEHALLRRMIYVAGEIAERAYGLPDDVTKTIDEAESMVFSVAERRMADSTKVIQEMLGPLLDRLEQLYERKEAVTGLATGYTDLDELLAGLQPSSLVVVGARPSMGKALSLDTAIPTPDGWTTMGNLRVGEEVLDDHGQPCTITYATPVQHNRRCYEVEFDDGSVIVADADHQWFAVAREIGAQRWEPRVVTTQRMLDEGVHGPGERRPNWHVPVAQPLDLPDQDLPVEPYVFGCWLSKLEHIPDQYLRASHKQRQDVLQGILDTDGGVTNGLGAVELCLANRALLEQVRELVCSLGCKPGPIRARSIPTVDGTQSSAFRFRCTPLGRMARHAITAIRPVASVPVRCITVDSPSHLYLAGESMIPTHNTAFALGMARNAAVKVGKPVLLFSLEMSQLEVTERLIAAEANVDGKRLRTGRLSTNDWTRINHAVGRLSPAPLFVDDNAMLTVMDIRAKARRLKSRVGELGLVIVDYIQLMTGRTDRESRQVEVSEISRNLKILARELETPVVACAQLNRQLEARADKRPMLSDLRESGCVTADTLITRADTGAQVSIGELLLTGARNIPVWSLDENLRVVPATLTHAFESGLKEVLEVRLASGRTVKASANHPFLCLDGWTRLDELQRGSRVAVPRSLPAPVCQTPWPDAEVVMLAHLLGDGCVAPRQPVHYTSEDPANLDAVAEAARHFGITPRLERQERWWHLYLPSPYRLTHGRRNPIQAWLSRFGLDCLRSHQKFIPGEVFSLPDDQLRLFVRHLWATDGCVSVRNRNVSVYYSSTSRRMIEDLQQLLLRFEIHGRIKSVRQGRHRQSHQLWIYGAPEQLRLLDGVGVHGARGALAEACAIPVLRRVVANTNRDTVPVEVWQRVKGSMRASGVTARQLAAGLEMSYCGSTLYRSAPSRARLERVANVLEDDHLRQLARSDVFWDEVVAITRIGSEPVYDATVLETHNFIADGIVVHNSIEQDADVVLFLYRDQVYNPETNDRDMAEVIVAKHRSGPTGNVRLAWLPQSARFHDMGREM